MAGEDKLTAFPGRGPGHTSTWRPHSPRQGHSPGPPLTRPKRGAAASRDPCHLMFRYFVFLFLFFLYFCMLNMTRASLLETLKHPVASLTQTPPEGMPACVQLPKKQLKRLLDRGSSRFTLGFWSGSRYYNQSTNRAVSGSRPLITRKRD